jgi:hypothetical protein
MTGMRVRDLLLARVPEPLEFLRCFADQAERKPDSTAAATRHDLAARMAAIPLEG